MTIASEITRLNNAKAAIKQSLTNKGVEVSDSALLDEYPALIDSIEVGGEGGDPFYEDYFNIKTINNTNYTRLYEGYGGTELDVSKLNTGNVSSMAYMFNGCSSLTSLDLSNFDTGNVNTMNSMFNSCYSLTSLDISSFDTSKVTYMNNMFNNCSGLSSLYLGSFSTNSVQNMSYMFYNCSSLSSLDINGWVIDSVTDMSNMFLYCSSLTSLDLSNWSTYNATDMSNMFADCSSLYELDIRNFNMANVSNVDNMFANCYSLTTLHLDECDYDTVNKIITSSGFPADNYGTIYCKSESADGLIAPGNWVFSHFIVEELPEVPEPEQKICPICGDSTCAYSTEGQNARCPECRKPYRTSNPNCYLHSMHYTGGSGNPNM